MQGSVLSLYFLHLLSDTVLQFPADFDVLSYVLHDSDFNYVKSSRRNRLKVNREKSLKVAERTIELHSIISGSRLFPIEGSPFAKQSLVMDVTIRVPEMLVLLVPSDRTKGSILRWNSDPQVGVKRWRTWRRRSVNIFLGYLRREILLRKISFFFWKICSQVIIKNDVHVII